MRPPASRISDAAQFRQELEKIYRISLPELDVPRGWLPRVERVIEVLAGQDLLRVSRVMAVRHTGGRMHVALDGPDHAELLARRIARDAPLDCRHCGGRLIDPGDGDRWYCGRCPGGRQRTARRRRPGA